MDQMTTNLVRKVLLPVVLFGSATVALAQPSTTLSGAVTDPQAAAIPFARIVVHLRGSSALIRVKADDQGSYRVVLPAGGTYVVAVEADGFRQISKTVVVTAGQAAREDFSLQLAGFTASVEVTPTGDLAVSVSRLEMPLQELPATVNVVSSRLIAEQGVNDLVSALKNVNNVYAYTTHGVYESYIFRGFSESVQLVDGVRTDGNRINTQTANIERIEVLKGPASVLSGNGAFGGTVNLVRKKPSTEPLYDLTFAAGQFNTRRVSGGATGPLLRRGLLYRVDFAFSDAEGWRRTKPRRFNLTPSLDWRIGAKDRMSFDLTFNRDRFATDAGIPVIDNTVPDIPLSRRFNTPNDFERSTDVNFRWRYTHRFGKGIEFRDTLSYRRYDDEYLSAEGFIFTAPSTIGRNYHYFQQHRRPWLNRAEFAFTPRKGIRQRLLAGHEFRREAAVIDRSSASAVLAPSIDLYDPIETALPVAMPLTRLDRFRNRYHAVYVHDQIDVTARLHLNLAGRYDIYDRWSRNDPVSATGIVTAGTVERRRETDAFTSRAGIVYQFSPWYSAYSSHSTSFRPINTVPSDGRNLEPETGRQIEVGHRVEVAGRRIALTNAFYELVKRNVTIARGGGVFDQAGRQRSRGVEVELIGQPTPQWHVAAGYGHTRATFVYFFSNSMDLSGMTPRFTPRHTFNLWSGYRWPNGLGANVGGRYMGRIFTNNTNTVRWGGYTVVDAALSFGRGNGKARYSVNVNNVLNRRYFTGSITGVDSRRVSEQLYPGRPREVLVGVTFRSR